MPANWIRCCDQMPKPGEYVLTSTIHGGVYIAMHKRGDTWETDGYAEDAGDHMETIERVVCWMPLPDVPKYMDETWLPKTDPARGALR